MSTRFARFASAVAVGLGIALPAAASPTELEGSHWDADVLLAIRVPGLGDLGFRETGTIGFGDDARFAATMPVPGSYRGVPYVISGSHALRGRGSPRVDLIADEAALRLVEEFVESHLETHLAYRNADPRVAATVTARREGGALSPSGRRLSLDFTYRIEVETADRETHRGVATIRLRGVPR